jgi:hypothetical protein
MKKILILSILLCFSIVNAQYSWTPAKVILKDGTSFRGLVKSPKHSGGLISIGSTKFKYKKYRKSKTKKYGYETVEEVIFGDEEFATLHYKYIPISAKRHVLMAQLVNRKVSLYSRNVSKFHSTTPITAGDFNTIPTGHYYDDSQFYLIRKNEKTAKLMAGGPVFFLQSFIRRAKIYFSDCKEVISYLEEDLYDISNITELVEEYNLLCQE